MERGRNDYYDQPELWALAGCYGTRAESDRADLVARLVLDRAPKRVLDVGAGNGLVANRLYASGVDVVAYDFSASALEGVVGPKVVGDVSSLPFEKRSFDVLVASEVLEHLDPSTFEPARREIARVAARFVVVTVPNAEDLVATAVVCPLCQCRSSPHRHVRTFREGSFESLVPGFVPLEVFTFGPSDTRLRRWEAVLRRDLVGRWPWPSLAICPQCGYSAKRDPGRPARRRAAALARFVRVRRKRWIAAVLSRE